MFLRFVECVESKYFDGEMSRNSIDALFQWDEN